jgi:hypothetical protein
MVAPTVTTLCLWLASGLATPGEVSTLLGRLGDADLVLMRDPRAARPVRVLLATRVAARAERVRQVLAVPASYRTAMPSFRRVEEVRRVEQGRGRVDREVAWELEVPLWNLAGKLWLRPRTDGVDVELAEGDFAPGLFHVTVHADRKPEHSVLTVEGHANVRDANLATRQLVQRSLLAEPAMTVAAAYVLLKSLARLAESGGFGRPSAAMVAPEPSSLDGVNLGGTALAWPQAAAVLAAVRSRPDGRLARVEVALPISAKAAKLAGTGLPPDIVAALPSWKKVTVAEEAPEVCTDPAAPCWATHPDLPLFSLDGTWKLRRRPWRARMVAGQREGALLGIDTAPSRGTEAVVILSGHPRLDRAGYAARKLIAAEPYLEHGLSLALTLVDAVTLTPALEGHQAATQ